MVHTRITNVEILGGEGGNDGPSEGRLSRLEELHLFVTSSVKEIKQQPHSEQTKGRLQAKWIPILR